MPKPLTKADILSITHSENSYSRFGNFQVKDKESRRGQNPDNALTTFCNENEVLLGSLFQLKAHPRGPVFVWVFVSLRTYAVFCIIFISGCYAAKNSLKWK